MKPGWTTSLTVAAALVPALAGCSASGSGRRRVAGRGGPGAGGSVQRCDDAAVPKPFANGKAYQSCVAYLMAGGGSIRKVQWNDGPAAANQVTAYFDSPVVWRGN
jgi:hypothetical protein